MTNTMPDHRLVHWTVLADDLDRLREIARREDRSITAEARRAIKRYVRDPTEEKDNHER